MSARKPLLLILLCWGLIVLGPSSCQGKITPSGVDTTENQVHNQCTVTTTTGGHR